MAATPTSDRECEDLLAPCEAGSFQSEAPTPVSDRVCEPCNRGTFSEQEDMSTCVAVTECAAGFLESTPATPTSNRVCVATTTTTTTTTTVTTAITAAATAAATDDDGDDDGDDDDGGGGGDATCAPATCATLVIGVSASGKMKKITDAELDTLANTVLQLVADRSGVDASKMTAVATVTGSATAEVLVTFDASVNDATVVFAQGKFAVASGDGGDASVKTPPAADQIAIVANGKDLTAGMSAKGMTPSSSSSGRTTAAAGEGGGSSTDGVAVAIVVIIVVLLFAGGLGALVVAKKRGVFGAGQPSAPHLQQPSSWGSGNEGGNFPGQHHGGVSNPAYAESAATGGMYVQPAAARPQLACALDRGMKVGGRWLTICVAVLAGSATGRWRLVTRVTWT